MTAEVGQEGEAGESLEEWDSSLTMPWHAQSGQVLWARVLPPLPPPVPPCWHVYVCMLKSRMPGHSCPKMRKPACTDDGVRAPR
mmetsp:Transcript_29671/g.87824  ORF Transcript_29671/g.87824 Transcript_29671/m.87824 type:complete len:84 (-) Transcript_29671:2872-3123(-)